MFWIGKLLGLLTHSKSVASQARLFHMFLSSVSAVVGITIVIGAIAGTLLLMLVYGGYAYLVSLGISRLLASALIFFLLLGIALVLGCFLRLHLRRLCAFPRVLQESEFPVTGYLQSVAQSFMQGYQNAEPKPRRRRKS